jgi:hypothetical protein
VSHAASSDTEIREIAALVHIAQRSQPLERLLVHLLFGVAADLLQLAALDPGREPRTQPVRLEASQTGQVVRLSGIHGG